MKTSQISKLILKQNVQKKLETFYFEHFLFKISFMILTLYLKQFRNVKPKNFIFKDFYLKLNLITENKCIEYIILTN